MFCLVFFFFFFKYKIEFFLYPNLSMYKYIYIYIHVKLPPENLNSDPYFLYLTSIYTYEITTVPRVCNGEKNLC